MASASLIRRRWMSAIPNGSANIASSQLMPDVEKPARVGFTGSSCTWPSMIAGELLACCLTPTNVDDRTPVPTLVKDVRGKLFGDRGYLSALLTQLLFEQGLHLITKLRKNMRKSSHAPFRQTLAGHH